MAACNPHRGNSLASHLESSEETWLRTTYYVRPLHPTLKFLMWDYGSLDESQEKDYVKAKLKMIERNSKMPEFKVRFIILICGVNKAEPQGVCPPHWTDNSTGMLIIEQHLGLNSLFIVTIEICEVIILSGASCAARRKFLDNKNDKVHGVVQNKWHIVYLAYSWQFPILVV